MVSVVVSIKNIVLLVLSKNGFGGKKTFALVQLYPISESDSEL